MATMTTARSHRSRLALLILGATMAASAFTSSDAYASCGDTVDSAIESRSYIRGIGGLMIGLPMATLSTFVAPAIAVGGDSSLDYGGGVAWSAVGAFGFGGTALGVMHIDCPFGASLFLPGLSAFAGSAITTTIWALAASEDEPEPPVVVGFQPIGENGRDGMMLTLGGKF